MMPSHADSSQSEASPAEPICRREMLRSTSCGFAALALRGLTGAGTTTASAHPITANRWTAPLPMLPMRAKRVIFLFMQGGVSHVDSFDYKPELIRRDGQDIDFVGVRFGTFGKASKRRLMKPLWKFRQYGESGAWVSDLFPHIAQHADDLCFLHGLQTEGVAHGPSTLFLHTGATNLTRPSVGSWINYGLGTENQNLPGFVTITPPPGKGGPRNYGNAFLPATYQGTRVGRAGHAATEATFQHLSRADRSDQWQRQQYEFLGRLNRAQRDAHRQANRVGSDPLDATIASYELAYRMQTEAPGMTDLTGETAATLKLYGVDRPETADFGRRCLVARRLAEAGVRYIQVSYSSGGVNPNWDQHSNMPAHADHALASDKPVAGLLADLKMRGLLDDTLVWWGGEFGRNPFAQGVNGRDHNPRGFTHFLAGGGLKTGFHYGQTDEIGHVAVDGQVHMHDLHATILHLLGLDHEQLTYRHAGRDFRLTDVHGRVVDEIIA